MQSWNHFLTPRESKNEKSCVIANKMLNLALKFHIGFILFNFVSCYSSFGVEKRIFGGNTAPDNKYPFFFQLKIAVIPEYRIPVYNCGATLIHKEFLLTAGHCVFYRKEPTEEFNGYNLAGLRCA